MTGEWVWSSEEESGGSSGDEGAKEALPVNTIEKASSDEEGGEPDEYYGQIKVSPSQSQQQTTEQNVPINLVLRLRYVKLLIFSFYLLIFCLFSSLHKMYIVCYINPFPLKSGNLLALLSLRSRTEYLPAQIFYCFMRALLLSILSFVDTFTCVSFEMKSCLKCKQLNHKLL